MSSLMKKIGFSTCVLLAGTIFGASAFAQDLRLELRAGAQITPHESIDAVADSNTIGSRSLRFSFGLASGFRTIIEYGGESNGETTRNLSLDVTFVRHRFMTGVEWGPTFFGFLRPTVGLMGGYALGSLNVETPIADYRDFSHDIIGDGYLGLEGTIQLGHNDSKWFGTGGVRFGARAQTGAQFDELKRLDEDDEDPWDRTAPVLGTLHPNGWYWDLGLAVTRKF